MREEHKHPILQKLEEYLKNTPKEQIDKDWSDILEKTDPESYYEKKYKQAFEIAKEVYHDHRKDRYWRDWLTKLFPELKEDKDENMRKALYADIRTYIPNERGDKYVTWLEKQGEKETTWNKEDEENMNNILYVFNQLRGISFYKEDDTAEKIINWLKSLKDRLYSNNEYDKDMLGAIEYCKKNNRPLEKEHLAWLEKQDEKRPAENVEIKFREGDKVVSNQDGKVYTVGTAYYVTGDNICLHDTDGNHKWTNEDDLDKNYRLWTIDDAKKGDILVVDGVWIVEFDKKMTDGCQWKDTSILTSSEYAMDDDICTLGSHMFYKDIWPASKEDIDLFKKKRKQYLASNSHNETKFKVGDKVTIEGDDTIYTIHSINLESCWLTYAGRGRGWAKLDSLKHYVE